MNPFQPFYNMKIGIVDLSASSVEVLPLDQEMMTRHLGGAAMCRALSDRYDDPLIFGTGPLTGSFAPASSLLIASFRSPRLRQLCHVPFMLRTGPDMKFSGIDFLVIKGTATQQSVLYVNNGAIGILPAGNLQDLPIPDVIRALKKIHLPSRSAILAGPAADKGVFFASASIGSRGSLDKAGLASKMAAKNLKGITFGGMDGLPFNADNPSQGKELEKRISADNNFKHRGFFSILEKLDSGRVAGKFLKQGKKKDVACYHCPSPCMTHVTFSRQDPGKGEIHKIQDGLLLLDHTGCATLAGKAGKNVLPVLQSCLQNGLDPAGAADILSEGGTLPEYLDALDKIVSDRQRAIEDSSPHPTKSPSGAPHLFGGGIAPILPADMWEKRVSLAMILGVCPIFLLRFPQITDHDLLGFISTREDVLKTMQEGLFSAIDSLFTV